MSRQRKKHPAIVYQRKEDRELVRESKREGNMPKAPIRCRRRLRLIEAESYSEQKREIAMLKSLLS